MAWLVLAGLLSSTAFAQDPEEKNPWSDLLGEEDPESEADESEAPPEAEEPPPREAAEPTPAPRPPGSNPYVPSAGMQLPPRPVSSAPERSIEAMAPQGIRIAPMRLASGLGLSESLVFGGDGGTSMTTVHARYGTEAWAVAAHLPFAVYDTADQRATQIGNLRVEGWAFTELGSLLHGFGVEAHFSVGGPAWTWVNQAEQLWPGGGLDLLWQARQEVGSGTTLLYRGGVGLHGARGFEPYPPLFFRMQASFGVDQRLSDRFGLVGEASLAYWDLSPFELGTLFRAELFTGMRARTGFVFPVFVWAGASPAARPAGIREATWVFDLTMAL